MGHRYQIWACSSGNVANDSRTDLYWSKCLNYAWASSIYHNCCEIDRDQFKLTISAADLTANLMSLFKCLSGDFWSRRSDASLVEQKIRYQSEEWHVFRNALTCFAPGQYVEVLRGLAVVNQSGLDCIYLDLRDIVVMHRPEKWAIRFEESLGAIQATVDALINLNAFRLDALADFLTGRGYDSPRTSSTALGVFTWNNIADWACRDDLNDFLLLDEESLEFEHFGDECAADL